MKLAKLFPTFAFLCCSFPFQVEAYQQVSQRKLPESQSRQAARKAAPQKPKTVQEPLEAAGTAASIKVERLKEVTEASDRILKEFNEKGGNARYSDDDLYILDAFKAAQLALDVNQIARTPGVSRYIKRELVQRAIEVSKEEISTLKVGVPIILPAI